MPLMVKLFDGDNTTTPEWEGSFADFKDANSYTEENWSEVERRLWDEGRYWFGGGAAPLVYIQIDRAKSSK